MALAMRPIEIAKNIMRIIIMTNMQPPRASQKTNRLIIAPAVNRLLSFKAFIGPIPLSTNDITIELMLQSKIDSGNHQKHKAGQDHHAIDDLGQGTLETVDTAGIDLRSGERIRPESSEQAMSSSYSSITGG